MVMAISESQLDTWSHVGSIQQSSDTYNAIKNVLEANGTPFAAKDYEVFLQGSYGNDTNIYAESDVDIVIKLNSCFYSDVDALKGEELEAYKAAFSDATYCYPEFKRDVLKVLTGQYGTDARAGDKAIAIAGKGKRRKADVIVACEFRRYYKFRASPGEYTSGICFWNKSDKRIANYPKQHSANLTARHQATGGWLKPMIRVLKNLRGRLVDDRLIPVGTAPSYYLEGLLYNVPVEKFKIDYQTCFVNTIKWIQNEAQKPNLICVNEQYHLLRDNSSVSWKPADAEAFLNAATKLWKSWP
jgi:hypothetical protein